MASVDGLKKKVQQAYKEWEEKTYQKSISKFPEREEEFSTVSFTPVKPLYIPE